MTKNRQKSKDHRNTKYKGVVNPIHTEGGLRGPPHRKMILEICKVVVEL